jgi:transcriptional regulator with XRE-family HTH domain
MYLIENVKFLRKLKDMTQNDLSDLLGIPRSTLGEYERGNTEPSLTLVLRLSKIFDTDVDTILKRRMSDSPTTYDLNNKVRVLAVSVDSDQQNNIELVQTRAEAGYLDGYGDPEYIKDLPKLNFPNLPRGHYRGFEISGDSMLPMESGSIVICKYVENLKDIKDDKTYVVISKRDGVVYKRIRNDRANQSIKLFSDNYQFLPYSMTYNEIGELWQYHAHLSFSDNKATFDAMLQEKLTSIQQKVMEIHQAVINK